MRDLLTQPLWQPDELGHPIPDSPHAVSVTMPTWQSVIGYEEEDPATLNRLQCGYPRFFCHPQVRELFAVATRRHARDGQCSLVFPSEPAARRCAGYLGGVGEITPWSSDEPAVVLTIPESLRQDALRYWRYCGEIVSSRQAEALLGEVTSKDDQAVESVRQRLAKWAGQSPEQVFLFPSGMAAMHAAFRALIQRHPDAKTVQIEFPYVDVFCIQRHLGNGAHLLMGDSAVEDLRAILQAEPIAGVFCEIPSNPLMRTVDLPAISALCQRHDTPLIVDDTIGTIYNIDVYPYADVVSTSLTKNISGNGDVMAGALCVSEHSRYGDMLSAFLKSTDEPELWIHDAQVLEKNSRDFSRRMPTINANAEKLAAYLAEHPKIEVLYYPKMETRLHYDTLRRPHGGYGGLLSFVLRDAPNTAPDVYDHLRVSKGPSLGTNFTLACPYTLLAHYQELEWAQACGVSRELIRVAVGMEAADDLIARFESALRSKSK